ncbi:MAG TPA: carboxypeptidase regulatory-like domain-containing protein, partial [Anaerolineae bacterium]|nr:carboxypeptidase regulatory-like domain-containing protein [Anaerolineae bacterium]
RPGGTLAWQQGWPRGAGIRYWEVWNEPDYNLFWRGTVEEYYRLLEVAYKSIKAADPEAIVILGGLAFYDQRDWFPALLRQTGGDPSRAYFDVFSFHHYLSVYNSEQLINQARTTLTTYGLADAPIWITESGVSVWDDYPATAHNLDPDTPFRATMMEQAAYILQNSALAFYHGVERYYHFQLHDDCGDGLSSAYGLRQNFSPHVCNPAEGKPRPAYAAYQLAAAQFRDVVPLWREKQYEQDRVAFYRPPDNSRLVALWATQGLTVTAAVSATGHSAQLYWIEPTETLSGTAGLSRTLTLTPTGGLYTLTLPAATNQNGAQTNDPTYQIGGQPYLLVEQDTLPPRTEIQPLPPASPPNFLLQWHGQDPGSDIAGYDVYVSEDSEPLKLWLENTPFNEAKYSGRVNHSYSFAVRARDKAGNEEPLPPHAQATTQIVAGPAVTGVVLGPGGEPVAHAAVTITGSNIQENLATNQEGQWPPLPLLPGAYEIQASAPSYGIWPAAQRVTLDDTPTTLTMTLAPLVNEIASGDFEGDQVWNGWEWAGQVNLSIDAFDGQAAARLGDGTGEPADCQNGQPGQLWALRQAVTIPTGPAPTLSFLYKIASSEPSSPEEVWLEVSLLGEDGQSQGLVPANQLWQAADWDLISKDLSEWQGQTITIQFQVIRCSEHPFSVSLDRVSVGPGK